MTFGKGVHVVLTGSRVDFLVVSNVVDLVFVQPFLGHDPWCVRQHFIGPSAMSDSFTSLGMGHGGRRLVRSTQAVRVDTDEQVHLWEG